MRVVFSEVVYMRLTHNKQIHEADPGPQFFDRVTSEQFKSCKLAVK